MVKEIIFLKARRVGVTLRYNAMLKLLAKQITTHSPIYRFIKSRWGECRVQGCRKFAGRTKHGRLHLLCKGHRHSGKFQYLTLSKGRIK